MAWYLLRIAQKNTLKKKGSSKYNLEITTKLTTNNNKKKKHRNPEQENLSAFIQIITDFSMCLYAFLSLD